MRPFFIFASLVVHFAVTASPTYLTGELNGSLSGTDYIVTGNIYVLPHDTLSIEPGSRIRFEPFTGIVVRGAFLCNGTAREPVLLTSVRDSLEGKPPQPFDWNGVEVTREVGKVVMAHTRMEFSTYGMNIKSSYTPVALRRVVFHQNGYASLTRDDNLVRVEEGLPVSYSWNLGESERAELREEGGEQALVEDTLAPQRGPRGRLYARLGLVALAAAGGALWLTGHLMAEQADERYHAESLDQGRVVELGRERDSWVLARNVGIILTGCGLTGLTATVVF